MPKFSVIIPVYNTEKYLKKCLDSVFKQNFDDFEVIIVNDGSTDKSADIINEYVKKYSNIIYILKKNGGLSSARNEGIKKAKGDYLLFLDSDDFFSEGFLSCLNDEITDEDVVRFQVRDVFDDGNFIEYKDPLFSDLDGISAFDFLVKCHYIEITCAYAFKRDFWIKNRFQFKKNAYHEDFGLIPLVIIKSKKVKSIGFIGYNYYQRSGSIMTSNSYDKVLKKTKDFLNHYRYLTRESSRIKGNLKTFKSYIANSVILKSTCLQGDDYKEYIAELNKMKVFDKLLDDTMGRKIKKNLIRISPKIYYKVVR